MSLSVYIIAYNEAKKIALDAYVYGYSLITTEVTRVQMTNVDKAEGLHAPMGQFGNVKRYPPADYRGVSAPNADTLYSVAWLDLSEPQVFSHPDMGERFFLFEILSVYANLGFGVWPWFIGNEPAFARGNGDVVFRFFPMFELGANLHFTKHIGMNFEFGYPWAKVGLNIGF